MWRLWGCKRGHAPPTPSITHTHTLTHLHKYADWSIKPQTHQGRLHARSAGMRRDAQACVARLSPACSALALAAAINRWGGKTASVVQPTCLSICPGARKVHAAVFTEKADLIANTLASSLFLPLIRRLVKPRQAVAEQNKVSSCYFRNGWNQLVVGNRRAPGDAACCSVLAALSVSALGVSCYWR